jgi:hypothetical protein
LKTKPELKVIPSTLRLKSNVRRYPSMAHTTPAILICRTFVALALLWQGAPAAVVETKLVQPLLLQPGESDVSFIPISIDFNSDGTNDVTVLPHPSGINLYTRLGSRVLIHSSPPPNLGGAVGSVPLNFMLGEDIRLAGYRWWEGGPLPSSDEQIYGDRLFDLSIVILLHGDPLIAQLSDFLGQNAAIGVEFLIGTNLHYGYIHLDFRPEHQIWLNGGGGYIYGWAYETQPRRPILTKPLATPELPVRCTITKADDNSFELSWSSQTAAVYRIQGCSTVTGPFLDFSKNITALSESSTVVVARPDRESFFWRIVRIY